MAAGREHGESRRSVRTTPEEEASALPGDELIARPIGSLQHAITIRRPPCEVWPWLAQMGAGNRAGWYSYDALDNGGRPSAVRIVPELQRITVGTVFPALPGVTDAFTVLALEPPRSLILGWSNRDGTPHMTWAFVLKEHPTHSTRLIVRARASQSYRFHGLPRWLSAPVIRIVHFVMQRRQLLGIARRVESSCPPCETASHSSQM